MSPTNEFVAAAFALLLVGSVLAARGGAGLSYRMGFPAIVIALLVVPLALAAPVWAIDVKLTMEEAKKSLAAGREPMLKASEAAKPEEIGRAHV